jgi:thiamine pyrophosphate-dependent acetolactate synthase large subunit-like protein
VPPAAVFVLTMRAVAGPRNAEPDGRRYDLLVFARGADETQAGAAARQALDQLGWIEAATLRSGEITNPDAVPEDLQPSFQRALETGCSVIVYDQP